MIPLYSILAEQNPYASLPMIVAIVCVVVLLAAFAVGFAKGFRRIGWGGLAWFATCIIFVLADAMFRGSLTVPFTNMGFTPEVAAFWAALIVAIVCILLVLAVHGVLTIAFRPKLKWVHAMDDENDLSEFGLEYEDDYVDYEDDDGFSPRGESLYRDGFDNPSIGNRIAGGFTCAVKSLMVLFIILSFAIFFVSATSVSVGPMGIILDVPIVQLLLNFATRYALEFLSIGLVIVWGVKGYTKGFLNSLRALIIIVGAVAATVFSFLLPFTQFSLATEGIFYFLGRLVERCVNLFGGANNPMAFIVGRILSGACLLTFFIILLVLLNIVLKKCCNMVQDASPIRVVDGALACVVFLLIGVALAIGIWCILYTADYCGIFHTTEIFSKDASLANGLYKFAESIMKPYIDLFVKK